jgi:hypothetical protein
MPERISQKIIEPTRVEEGWTVIYLPNGDKIRMKQVIAGVFVRHNDEGKPVMLAGGEGVEYGIVSQMVIFVEPKGEATKGMM